MCFDTHFSQRQKPVSTRQGKKQLHKVAPQEKQQRHNDLIRAVPPNLHVSPCLQGQETPEPPLGTELPTGRPSLPLLDSLWDKKAEKSRCFLARISEQQQLSTGEKSSPQVYREHLYRESLNEFACIKLEQNTNQHEMQRAEVFLSHVHTHTHAQSTAGQHTFDRQDSGNPVLATRFFLYSRLKYKEEHSDGSPLAPQ